MLYPITPFCNQRCIFCSAYGRKDKDFDLKNFILELQKDDDNLIILSGGEPFSIGIDNMIYIADFVLKRKKVLEIQTNATLIPNIEERRLKILVSLLKKTGGYFNVNIPSHRSDMDYRITRIKDGFEKRIKGIEILNNLGSTIRVTHVIHKINYKYLFDFAQFILKKIPFISWVQFSFVKGIGKAEKNKKIIPKYSDVSPFLIKAFEVLDENGFYFEVDHIPLCFLGKYYDRQVDFKKMSEKIHGEYLKEKEKLPSCKGCKFYSVCSGPRKDYIEIYKKL